MCKKAKRRNKNTANMYLLVVINIDLGQCYCWIISVVKKTVYSAKSNIISFPRERNKTKWNEMKNNNEISSKREKIRMKSIVKKYIATHLCEMYRYFLSLTFCCCFVFIPLRLYSILIILISVRYSYRSFGAIHYVLDFLF